MNDRPAETFTHAAETSAAEPAAPADALSPRRERFCRYYLTEPSATGRR